MIGHKAVGGLADERESRNRAVGPRRNSGAAERPGPEHGVRAGVHAAVRLDQVHRTSELSSGEARKAGGDLSVLQRDVLDAIAKPPAPARKPEPAEPAIAVKQQCGLWVLRLHCLRVPAPMAGTRD